MKTTVITHFNYKGGTGKSVDTCLQSYLLAEHHHYHVLLVDFDSQANSTEMMGKTYHTDINPAVDLNTALRSGDLSSTVVHLSKYLDIIPANIHLMDWANRAEKLGAPNRYLILKYALKPIADKYDFIEIDTTPTFNSYSLNAIFASDYLDLVVQSQPASYSSALKTVTVLGELKKNKKYNLQTKLLGVTLFMLTRGTVDKKISAMSKKMFGAYMFKHSIYRKERVKGFCMYGIQDDNRHWNKDVLTMFDGLTKEMLGRIKTDEAE